MVAKRRIREWGPLGRFRFVDSILTGNLQLQFGVLSLSLAKLLTTSCSSKVLRSFLNFILIKKACPRTCPREAWGAHMFLCFLGTYAVAQRGAKACPRGAKLFPFVPRAVLFAKQASPPKPLPPVF
jgi:hypothetical protein